jgi:transcriptional regulator with XRE-family HTH domain
MKSKLGEVLREEREKLGITQRELARVLAVDRAMISRYETGAAQMPHDLLCRAVGALGSNKLRTQACFECQINLLTMPWLDQVDMHPMTVISVVVEELQEAIGALEGLRLANKRTAADLDDADYKAMSHAGEQVVDLLSAINTLLSGWHEWYGFDIDAQAVKGYKKLFARGYATPQSFRVAEVQRLYPRPVEPA